MLLVLLTCLGVGAGPAQARDADDFTFESFAADYFVARDADGGSSMRVVETLVAVFPDFDQNHGIERALPQRYAGVPLHTRVLAVRDEAGTPLPYTTSSNEGFDVLRIGSPDAFVHGRVAYVIEYEVQDVVHRFPETGTDELYWDTNGTGWYQPFSTVSARVHLPTDVAAALSGDQACYQGSVDSELRCDIVSTPGEGETVLSATAGPFYSHQNMTLAIGFTPGFFDAVTAPSATPMATVLPWALTAFPLMLLLVYLVLRLGFWRNSRGRGIVVPQYTVPDSNGVMVAAEVLRVPKKAPAALLTGFAVRRAARIVEDPDAPKRRRYTIEPVGTGDGLAPDDRAGFITVFRGWDSVLRPQVLRRSNTALGTAIRSLRLQAESAVNERGLRMTRGRTLVRIIDVLATLSLTVGGGLLVWWAIENEALSITFVLAIVIAIVVTVIVVRITRPRVVLTDEGADYRDYLYGLRDYLRLAEADRLRVLQSPTGAERVDATDGRAVLKLYEKLLPYAVLFGVEREWSRVIDDYYDAGLGSAEWFVGSRSPDFTSSMSAFGSQATSSRYMPQGATGTSAWSSSGSSSGSSSSGGSSGGGSSGGGGGGGGGGGW